MATIPGASPRWRNHVLLIAIILVLGSPLLYALLVSTQSNTEFFAHQLKPGGSLRENFDHVWTQRHLGRFMANSAFQAVVITTGKAITAMLAGMVFVYFDFAGRAVTFWLVLVTLMMPTEISIIDLSGIIGDFGWGDHMAAITIPFLASATGAFMFRQHFSTLPSELSEAARIDGAGPMQFLFRILLPLSWNVIGALAVIQFLYAWNMYLWPSLVIQSDANQVVQVGLGSLQNVGGGQSYGPLMLGAVIASVPPTVVFILLQKTFLKGFAITSGK